MYRIQNRFNQYQLQNLFTVDAHEYDEGDDDGVYSPTFFEKNVDNCRLLVRKPPVPTFAELKL